MSVCVKERETRKASRFSCLHLSFLRLDERPNEEEKGGLSQTIIYPPFFLLSPFLSLALSLFPLSMGSLSAWLGLLHQVPGAPILPLYVRLADNLHVYLMLTCCQC